MRSGDRRTRNSTDCRGLRETRVSPKVNYITITADEISTPKEVLSCRPIIIKRRDIKHVRVQVVLFNRYLIIAHANGEVTLTAWLMPNRAAFEQLRAA